jgi:hypothetical protein
VVAGPEPPVPPNDRPQESGKGVPPRDMREEFARITAGVDRDPEAERAFVESKIEMIRTHPTLSEAEKMAAIAELEEKLKGDT